MQITYSLTENDFLQQQLYLASKSKQLIKQRKISRILVFVILILFAFLFYMSESKFFAYYFASASIVCFCFFPFYLKKYYKRSFSKFVTENFKEKIGIVSKIMLYDEAVETSNTIGDSKINLSMLKDISETKDYFFINFKTKESLIIPKESIEDLESLRNKLKTITEKMKIDFLSELDWKWK